MRIRSRLCKLGFCRKFTSDSLSRYYRTSLIPTWIKNTHYFYYAIERNGERDFYLDNAAKDEKKLLFDNRHLADEITRLTQIKYTPEKLNIYRLDFYNQDLNKFYINKEHKIIEYNIKNKKARIVDAVPKTEENKPSNKRSTTFKKTHGKSIRQIINSIFTKEITTYIYQEEIN